MLVRLLTMTTLIGLATEAAAQLNVPSDGSDGVLTAGATINLSESASMCDCDGGGTLNDPCRWDCPSPIAGRGVYDSEQWAVVFKYASVLVPDGKTVRFAVRIGGISKSG